MSRPGVVSPVEEWPARVLFASSSRCPRSTRADRSSTEPTSRHGSMPRRNRISAKNQTQFRPGLNLLQISLRSLRPVRRAATPRRQNASDDTIIHTFGPRKWQLTTFNSMELPMDVRSRPPRQGSRHQYPSDPKGGTSAKVRTGTHSGIIARSARKTSRQGPGDEDQHNQQQIARQSLGWK